MTKLGDIGWIGETVAQKLSNIGIKSQSVMAHYGKFSLSGLSIGVLIFTLGACGESEGPAEKAGKTLDQGIEKAGDILNRSIDKTGDVLEKAGDAMSKEAKDLKEGAADLIDDVKGN